MNKTAQYIIDIQNVSKDLGRKQPYMTSTSL